MKVTVSAIKADVGSIGGHIRPSNKLLSTVENFVREKRKGLLIDHLISFTGDDIAILCTHQQGFFGPAMLPYSELEYGGIVEKLKKINNKFTLRKK